MVKALFGLVSLLVVLAIVFMLTGKQLGTVKTVTPEAAANGQTEPTTQQSPAEIQKQYKEALGKALEQTQRRMPDE